MTTLNIIFIAIILMLIVGFSIFYYFFTRDTYIVRIHKKEIMQFRTSIELTGLPIITFYQGKEKYNFLLDTGSNMSYINEKSPLIVEKTGEKDVFMGAEGKDIACEYGNIKLYKDDVEYEFKAALADLDNAFTELKNSYGVTISGLLGNDFFIKYQYCLDFKELVVYRRK